MTPATESSQEKPSSVVQLERLFGGPSRAAFGTAVFYEPAVVKTEELEQRALANYKYFVGEIWERFGEENWLGTWNLVFAREAGERRQILDELKAIKDPDARLSASTMVDSHEHSEQAQAALSNAFDDPDVCSVQIYKIGDGEAMSGVMIVAQRQVQDALFLVFLMD